MTLEIEDSEDAGSARNRIRASWTPPLSPTVHRVVALIESPAVDLDELVVLALVVGLAVWPHHGARVPESLIALGAKWGLDVDR